MKEQLDRIFTNVNDWLKFAEAKSASLIAANGVILFGALDFTKETVYPMLSESFLYFSHFLFGMSLLLCLSSFVPSLTLPWTHKKNTTKNDDNLLFFGHIENYTPISYLNKLSKALGTNNYQISEYDVMLSKQIITNSVIASYKYSIFKKSIWLTLIGFFTLFIASLFKLLGV